MSDRHQIPEAVIKAAQDYDREHFREDESHCWTLVTDDQARRLIWGALEAWRALGFVLLPAEAGALDLAVIGAQDRSEEG